MVLFPLIFSTMGSRPIFKDLFNEAVDTDLATHGPDIDTVGAGWVIDGGTWQVRGADDIAEKTATNTPTQTAHADTGVSDATMVCHMIPGAVGAPSAAVCFRHLNELNFLEIQLRSDTNTISLFERVAGTFTSLASASTTINAGQSYEIKIAYYADNIQAYLDGTRHINHTTTRFQTETNIGMAVNRVSVANEDFEDITVFK